MASTYRSSLALSLTLFILRCEEPIGCSNVGASLRSESNLLLAVNPEKLLNHNAVPCLTIALFIDDTQRPKPVYVLGAIIDNIPTPSGYLYVNINMMFWFYV